MHRLYLASTSPRRRELLGELGIPFTCIDPPEDDRPRDGEAPEDYALRVAHDKARGAADALPPAGEPRIVLGSDTVVALGDTILGKPNSAEHAHEMLRQLSGKEHRVLTAIALLIQEAGAEDREEGEVVSTKVSFRELSDDEINRYVASGEPMDKAGSYAIQGGAAHMVRWVEGSYTNVIGLPVAALADRLSILGLSGKDGS